MSIKHPGELNGQHSFAAAQHFVEGQDQYLVLIVEHDVAGTNLLLLVAKGRQQKTSMNPEIGNPEEHAMKCKNQRSRT